MSTEVSMPGGYLQYFDNVFNTVLIMEPQIVLVKVYTLPQQFQQRIRHRFECREDYWEQSRKAIEAQARERGLPLEVGAYRENVVDSGIAGPPLEHATPKSITLDLKGRGYKVADVFWFEKPRKNGAKQMVFVLAMSKREVDREVEFTEVQYEIIGDLFSIAYKTTYPWANLEGLYSSDQYFVQGADPIRVDTLNFNIYEMDVKGRRIALVYEMVRTESGTDDREEYFYKTI